MNTNDTEQRDEPFDGQPGEDEAPPKPPSWGEMRDRDPEALSKRAAVKVWLARIARAKQRWEGDFKRMEADCEFAFGLQRTGQPTLHEDEYSVNLVNRAINQKVATLYAKNPTVEYQRRKRLDFQLWNGKLESLQPILQKAAMGVPPDMNDLAMMADFQHGMETREMIDKVGKTLEIAFQCQIDEHDPEFKTSMKSLVRRVETTGVGYVYVSFARDIEAVLSSTGMDNTVMDRARRVKLVLEQLEKDGQGEDSPRVQELKSLMTSMSMSFGGGDVGVNHTERLVFDFLPSTSVIPDENCRCLKGFIGARFIAIERRLPLDEVNAFFECDIKLGGEVKVEPDKLMNPKVTQAEAMESPICTLYEVIDKMGKDHFFVVEGCKDYVQEPETFDYEVRGFWPLFALTFNDSEYLPGTRGSIFPPSDVTLMRSPQKEWIRTREELRRHRNANAAKYITQKGILTENDKDKLENSESNAVIELEGLAPNVTPDKALVPMQHDAIAPGDPRYDVNPLLQDILLSIGNQEANIGPPNPKGTATGQSIAEQSRNVGITSNIDDLDDFLTAIAVAGGELMMQAMSNETFQRIVGEGAVIFPDDRKQLLNLLYLKVVAASSGKPNKVLELQNWQLIAPTLMAAGANPMFMVRETIRRVDDRMDPEEAFPLVPPSPQGHSPHVANNGGRPQRGGRGTQPHESGQMPRPQGRPGPGRSSPQGQPMTVGQR